jgi:hypothetical protein
MRRRRNRGVDGHMQYAICDMTYFISHMAYVFHLTLRLIAGFSHKPVPHTAHGQQVVGG